MWPPHAFCSRAPRLASLGKPPGEIGDVVQRHYNVTKFGFAHPNDHLFLQNPQVPHATKQSNRQMCTLLSPPPPTRGIQGHHGQTTMVGRTEVVVGQIVARVVDGLGVLDAGLVVVVVVVDPLVLELWI